LAGEIKFDWDDSNIKHLARHNVKPEEAEQVIASDFIELEYEEAE